jgi:hypothetical protein
MLRKNDQLSGTIFLRDGNSCHSYGMKGTYIFQLVLTAVEAKQRGVAVTKREQGQQILHKIL